MSLLGPDGRPISSASFKKAAPPKLGEAFGAWAGRDVQYASLPGGGIVQFDLSKLTLADYRAMRDHYQVNASLSVLSFMMHQSDWHIESKNKKIAQHCEDNLREVWTQLNRSMSTAHWAGFSPNALQWENDTGGRTTTLNKIKDLPPEECAVNWKKVEGWAPPGRTPPKFNVFDGIKQYGMGWPIPVSNSFWYPMLMEEGNHEGRKLLRPAFQSWFFSILVHLFANRYYERFGEPVPVGRAPFEDEITIQGTTMKGNQYMLALLQQLRNRSVVVLPNDMTDFGDGKREFDYDIEYLESQMRGADFERYLTRLDEEVSLGIFTPILLMRTSDVGSYNLGTSHMQLWLWMLNALNGDRKFYIDKYLLRPMVDINFSKNAPDAKIVFRKLGHTDSEMVRAVVTELLRKDKIKPDLMELGQAAGMDFKEIKETIAPPPIPGDPNDPNADPSNDPNANPEQDKRIARTRPEDRVPPKVKARNALGMTAQDIFTRVSPQVENAMRDGRFGPGLDLSLGFKKRVARILDEYGYSDAGERAEAFFRRMDARVEDAVSAGDAWENSKNFLTWFSNTLGREMDEVVHTIYCVRCDGFQGGPYGHETNECTWNRDEDE